MDEIRALTSFWNSFGIPAYDSSSVPESAAFPYITFDVAQDSFGAETIMQASVWYRSTSWEGIEQTVEAISQKISRGGVMIESKIWLKKGTPFAQRVPDEDDAIRRYVLNVTAEYMTA